MTNKELKNKIAEKFVSIMRKLRHIVMGQLMQNCLPYFKTLIMACMKMMEKEEINFTMSSEEQQATNDMFYYLGVPDRIRLIPNFSDGREDHRRINDNLNVPENNPKLENIYNLLNTIDNLLDAKDIYGNLKLIEELSLQIEREETNND